MTVIMIIINSEIYEYQLDVFGDRKFIVFWRCIWRLDVQSKVKIFGWRLFNNLLPSADNLARRGMEPNMKCPVCGFENETIMHTLTRCWWSRVFWEQLGHIDGTLDINFSDPGDWIWYCVFHRPTSDLKKILYGARLIWYNRNLMATGSLGLSPIVAAKSVSYHFEMANNRISFQMVTSLADGLSWFPPQAGYVKLNIDGSWSQESRRAGIGICCKNEEGLVCLVATDFFDEVTSSDEAELLAMWRALKIANLKGLEKVILETDCYQVALSILRGSGGDHLCSQKMRECRDLLQLNTCWSINIIFREANGVADFLARRAKVDKWRWSDLESIPRCLQDVL